MNLKPRNIARPFPASLRGCAGMIVILLALSPVLRAQDDPAALLAKADVAFAAAEYQMAIDIWDKLEGKLDPAQAKSVAERKRFAQRQLAIMKARGIDPTVPARPVESKSPTTVPATQPARMPHKKPADGQVLEVGLHDLGNFEFDENNDASLPADVKALTGSSLRVEGQMLALDQSGKVSRFILVNDLMSCCFGVVPKLQHIVYVQLPKDKWVESTTERLSIEGKLTVNVRKQDGYVLSIFELEPTSIKYAPQ
jgi:hypothetical protein